MIPDPPTSEQIAGLLTQIGVTAPFQVTSLAGGGNNRVYRIDAERDAWLLKAYFQHPADPRNRLQAEFGFARFAWEQGLRRLPRPLACDREHNLGLYEFLAGRRFANGEIGQPEIRQALEFFGELNRHKSLSTAARLPHGSEACFSLAEHLACVERRLDRLSRIVPSNPLDQEAAELVAGRLRPAWEHVRSEALGRASILHLGIDAPLPAADRCLSPSDFGFHNALRAEDGRVRFFDFEYAGWDDPAKTVCDFFCQPAVAVPQEFWTEFADGVASTLSDPPLQLSRFALLRPVYQVKWCCIQLNEFLPDGSQRRSFARGDQDALARKQSQLHQARAAVQKILLENAHGTR